MALVRSIRDAGRERYGVHKVVNCEALVFTIGAERYLQLDTMGSSQRQERGKVSQSMQFDRAGAEELLRVLRQAFPGIG